MEKWSGTEQRPYAYEMAGFLSRMTSMLSPAVILGADSDNRSPGARAKAFCDAVGFHGALPSLSCVVLGHDYLAGLLREQGAWPMYCSKLAQVCMSIFVVSESHRVQGPFSTRDPGRDVKPL